MTMTTTPRTAPQYVAPGYEPVGAPDAYLPSKTTVNRTSEQYVAEQWASDRRLAKLWLQNGTDTVRSAQAFAATVRSERHSVYADRLAELARQYRLRDGKELVGILATEYGFAWVDVARMLGVSVPAIRKWRMAGGVSPENTARLADVAALAYLLSDRGVRPAAWLSTPLVAGYTVAPKHLYSAERVGALADIALGTGDAQDLLAEFEPDWRSKYDARGYEVARFDDGTFGIVHRPE